MLELPIVPSHKQQWTTWPTRARPRPNGSPWSQLAQQQTASLVTQQQLVTALLPAAMVSLVTLLLPMVAAMARRRQQ